jgi:hypothetical protein
MTQSEIIDALGGTGAVADATGCKQSAVSMWRHNGIPWKRRPTLARLAKEKRVALPADFLVPL